MDFHCYTTFPEELESEWNALLEESVTHVPFLRHEYLSAWWQTHGGGEWPPEAALAIITALMVEVSRETFAIPLSGVIESIRIQSSEIHDVGDNEVVKLRERLLPVHRLDRYFGLKNAASREHEYIVVVGSGEKRGGLVVDRLVGQQEIVIKALDDYLGDLPGISGGTVLGDGSISMIMDIGSILTGTRNKGRHEERRV